MTNRGQNIIYSKCITVLCFTFTASFLSVPTNGGLLSSYIYQYKNFHYVVRNDFDTINSDIETANSSEDAVTFKEKGMTTFPSPILSNHSSASFLHLRTSYYDCGSAASIKTLVLSPCNAGNSGVCEIKRGSNITFNLSFVPKTTATQLKAVIHGIIDFVPVPFPSPEPDACQNSGIVCPIQAGKQYDYVLSTQIKQSYPKMKLWVKGQLEDEHGSNVVCVEIHVKIV